MTALCAALAAAADLDLVYPPAHRTMTHSVTAIFIVMIVAIVVTGRVTAHDGRADRGRWGRGSIVLLCSTAYASHLLLDWLGADPSWPNGIQALWPFSRQWFISGLNIFPYIERRQMLSLTSILINIKAIAGEIVVMGPLVAVLGWLRRR
jgi:inner membrane protein